MFQILVHKIQIIQSSPLLAPLMSISSEEHPLSEHRPDVPLRLSYLTGNM